MTRACIRLILLVGGLALASPNLCAFQISPYQWPQAKLGDPVSLTYSYSNLLDPGLFDNLNQPISPAYLRQTIEEALALWASVVPVHFVEMPDSGPYPSEADYPAAGKPQIRIGHHKIDGFGAAKAHAFYPSGTGVSGDVHLDNSERWAVVGTYDNPDVLGIVLHELGHSLGLAHTEDPSAVMYFVAHRMMGPGTAFLAADDIAGIRSIYGAGTGSVTPLPVPEPATAALAVVAAALAWCGGSLRRRRNPAGGWASPAAPFRGRGSIRPAGLRFRRAQAPQSGRRRRRQAFDLSSRGAPVRMRRARRYRSRLRLGPGSRRRCSISSRRHRSGTRRRGRLAWRARLVLLRRV